MAGIVGLSKTRDRDYEGDFSLDMLVLAHYNQLFSEEQAGWSVFNENQGRFKTDTSPGTFRGAFEDRIHDFEGDRGICYCGRAKEPFEVDTKVGKMSLCFSGIVRNYLQLKENLKRKGMSFSDRKDKDLEIEIIAKLIAEGKDVVDGIEKMNNKVEGSYTLLVLTEKEIFASRSPDGHWVLTIGKKDNLVVASSSNAGFYNIGLDLVRDIRPGEIISLRNGAWRREAIIESETPKVCSFISIYMDYPAGVFQGTPISFIRKESGKLLALKDLREGFVPDFVIPVPNSGRSHAIGYHQEMSRWANRGDISSAPLYEEILMRWPYAGRSFTPSSEEKRKREADIKILPTSEKLQGEKHIVVVDDSIVRGTQTSTNLVPKLRSIGEDIKIHLRIANPPLVSYCPWGKSTKKGETLHSKCPFLEDKIEYLGIDSLKYNSIDDLVKAIGIPRSRLCVDCSLPAK